MPYFFILPAFVMYVAAMAMGIAITTAHRPWRWLRPSLVSVLIWSSIGFVISNVVYVGVAVIAWRVLEPLTAGGPSVIGGIAGAFLLFVAPFIAAAVGLAAGATFAIWRKLKRHLLSGLSRLLPRQLNSKSALTNMQAKAVRQGYEPQPFFFVQRSENGLVRLLAWAPSLSTVRRAFEELIKAFPPSVEVLLKVKADSEESRDPVWQRYHGVVAQGALLEAMARCDTFVFQDSRNQLCIRDPMTFDYVVLDDVGVVYVYSDAAVFRDVLEALGFEERLEPLVSEEGYWSQTPAAGQEQESEFVRLLRLTPVPGPGESWDSRALH